MIVRARILLPIARPPIDNGAVVIERGRIVNVGAWPELRKTGPQPVIDCGEAILLPGLVNAHCHLDYTDMAGQIPPRRSFADWIKSINALKAARTDEDYIRSWLKGAEMLARHGVTTVGDIEAVPSILNHVRRHAPLRVFSYLELIGVRRDRSPEDVLASALAPIDDPSDNLHGLSPHAPYSTTPALVSLAMANASERHWRVTMHVAESQEEYDMFSRRRGPLYDWLATQRDMSDCGYGSPVQVLASMKAFGPNLLVVHANYLARGDAELVAEHGASIVHCPRSHRYFQHAPFHLRQLRRLNVNICLGTDSLATVIRRRGQTLELDLFAEMQALAAAQPRLSSVAIVRMATINGARALGWENQVGQLVPRAWADLIAIPSSASIKDSYTAVVHHHGPVLKTIIAGKFAFPRESEMANNP